MMNYDPCHWRPIPSPAPQRSQNYWDVMPGCVYRPPMNTVQHTDKYFYTVLFLDHYYDGEVPPNPNPGLTLYSDITETFDEDSPIQWEAPVSPLSANTLIVKHNLHLPVTLETWDNNSKPIVYAPLLKQDISTISIGGCTVQDEHTIKVTLPSGIYPTLNEKFLLGIKELPDFKLDPIKSKSQAIQTLEEFMAVPKYIPMGLAIVFRRNSLEALFDLISDFDETYFHSMDESAGIKYLVKKSCYKDVSFLTLYTNNLQDVLDKVDVNYYRVEYSWQQYKRYKDGYNNYEEKYGYR